MKKLIYVMVILGITGVVLFPAPKWPQYSKDLLKCRTGLYHSTPGDLSQLLISDPVIANELYDHELHLAGSLNKAPKYFNQGWPLKDEIDRMGTGNVSTIPMWRGSGRRVSCICGVPCEVNKMHCCSK